MCIQLVTSIILYYYKHQLRQAVSLVTTNWYFSGSEGARQQQLDPSNLPLIKEKDQHQNNLQSLAATSLGNLLQQLGALDKGAMDEDRLAGAGCGILLGEALPPVPTKLANKIKKGDFVEMQEMLPDMWLVTDQSEPTARVGRLRAMDIKVWSQCFATYVRVIAEDEPERVPDLLDYMINIIRASQDFMGSAWLKYDNTFRRQVAVSGNKKWGTYNSSLYSMCFTGKAQTLGRCEHCLSKDHNLQPCPLRSDQPPAQLEINHSHHKEYSQASNESWPRCRRFNEGRCDHVDCSYRHVCIKCGERHPAIYCGQQGRGWRGRSRGRAPRRRPY